MTELKPFTPELLAHNRRAMAARMHWPEGALEACDKIADRFPGWNPGYDHGGKVGTHEWPAGFYASHQSRRHGEPRAYGVTPEALTVAIEEYS
jgi:hypothetical protein